jgi:hypothetical protein
MTRLHELPEMVLLFPEAFCDVFVFVVCVVSCRRLRPSQLASFKMATFLKLLGFGMLMIAFAQCLLEIIPVIPRDETRSRGIWGTRTLQLANSCAQLVCRF